MKRLLAITISALLLCPMTSFAAQTEEARAVYQELMEKSQTTNDMNAYYDMTVKMTGDMVRDLSVDSLDMRIEMNARMQNLTDPSQMRYHIFSRLSMLGEQMEYSIYYGDGYYYMDMMGQKVKYPMAMDQTISNAMAAAKMFETSTDYFKDLTVRTEGENRILSYTIDDAKLNEYIRTLIGASGMESLFEGISVSVSNVGGEYIINPEGDYTKIIMNMDMSMTVMGETIHMEVAADVGIADPGQPVAINAPNPQDYVEQPAR